MHIPESINNPAVPFEGFSLKHSTSFSEEHDEFAVAKFEEHQIASVPKNVQQKYIKQVYSNETGQELITNRQGDVVAIKDSVGRKFFPLERKPAVFEKR